MERGDETTDVAVMERATARSSSAPKTVARTAEIA
jgi:hypothetical protein